MGRCVSTNRVCCPRMRWSSNLGTQQGWSFAIWIIMALKSIRWGLCRSRRESAMWERALLGQSCLWRPGLKKNPSFSPNLMRDVGGDARGFVPCWAEQALRISLSICSNMRVWLWFHPSEGTVHAVSGSCQRRQKNMKDSRRKGGA